MPKKRLYCDLTVLNLHGNNFTPTTINGIIINYLWSNIANLMIVNGTQHIMGSNCSNRIFQSKAKGAEGKSGALEVFKGFFY